MPHPEPERREQAPTGAERLRAGLMPEQARAVGPGREPLLVLAGPGAGKTRTLAHRIAYLLMTGVARPSEILAVTFSVRAAGELRLRLADLLGQQWARGVGAECQAGRAIVGLAHGEPLLACLDVNERQPTGPASPIEAVPDCEPRTVGAEGDARAGHP